MKKADHSDKEVIVQILTASFDDNQSVNYIIKQDTSRVKRIKKLMEYSFDVCFRFGEVLLSDDRKGCALVLYPDKKKSTTWLDIQLIFGAIGLANIKKAMQRESKIKKLQPRETMYYLWFIGVDPLARNRGTGTALMHEIIKESKSLHRSVYLETSTTKNIPWYKQFGFTIYNELDLNYRLFFMKREV